jgi:hypothetical protein
VETSRTADPESKIACRWCGLFSEPGPACELCGSPLQDIPWLQLPQLQAQPAPRSDPVPAALDWPLPSDQASQPDAAVVEQATSAPLLASPPLVVAPQRQEPGAGIPEVISQDPLAVEPPQQQWVVQAGYGMEDLAAPDVSAVDDVVEVEEPVSAVELPPRPEPEVLVEQPPAPQPPTVDEEEEAPTSPQVEAFEATLLEPDEMPAGLAGLGDRLMAEFAEIEAEAVTLDVEPVPTVEESEIRAQAAVLPEPAIAPPEVGAEHDVRPALEVRAEPEARAEPEVEPEVSPESQERRPRFGWLGRRRDASEQPEESSAITAPSAGAEVADSSPHVEPATAPDDELAFGDEIRIEGSARTTAEEVTA